MKILSLYFLFFIGFLFIITDTASAQYADTLAYGNDEVVELTTAEIKITIETPQVTLYSSRVTPEFDDVHLEKSFKKEITGLGETFVFKQGSQDKITTRIDVGKIIKKLR